MRGVSLEEIAQETKIGTRLLRALEEEQFDLLPGGIFNKGFVRAYAKHLGINEEQAVADYLQAAGDMQPDVQLIAEQNQYSDRGYHDSEKSPAGGFPFVPVLILLLIAGAGFGGWKLYQQHLAERELATTGEPPKAEERAAPSSSTERPANVLSGQSGSDSTEAKTATAGPGQSSSSASNSAEGVSKTTSATGKQASSLAGATGGSASAGASPFEVVVRSTDRAWVSIKADGNIRVRGIIDPGQVKTIQASNEIVVWTGNAGVTQILFNQKPVTVEGGTNDVRILVFKSTGLASTTTPPPPVKKQETPAEKPAEPSPTPQ
jgi:cytoskeleton protein RodZ